MNCGTQRGERMGRRRPFSRKEERVFEIPVKQRGELGVRLDVAITCQDSWDTNAIIGVIIRFRIKVRGHDVLLSGEYVSSDLELLASFSDVFDVRLEMRCSDAELRL